MSLRLFQRQPDLLHAFGYAARTAAVDHPGMLGERFGAQQGRDPRRIADAAVAAGE
jgi:hypothetical protein